MVAPHSLAHVVFRTNNLKEMRDWYTTVLEAEEAFGDEKISFLSYDEEHHRIALVATQAFAEKPKAVSVGFYHSAFAYEDLGQLIDTYERLKEHGIVPWRTINHGPTISFYYADPDGNDVELQVDRFSNANDATKWMKGPAFAKNPIGVEFDIKDFIRDYRGGKSPAELMRRPDE
jgi:catechol-2,3-dioxygenase